MVRNSEEQLDADSVQIQRSKNVQECAHECAGTQAKSN